MTAPSLVCAHCKGRTVLSGEAAEHPPDGPFLCASCLVGRQATAARRWGSSEEKTNETPGFFERVDELPWWSPTGVVIRLAVGIGGTILSAGFLALVLPGDRPAVAPAGSVAPSPPPVASANGDPVSQELRGLEARDAAARGATVRRALVAYTEGFALATTDLPKPLPAIWTFADGTKRPPLAAEGFGLDAPLTEARFLVERDRLRIAGRGQRAGADVRCGASIEPAGKEPAAWIAACVDEAETWTIRVARVALPTLDAVLAKATQSSEPLVPAALRGSFRTHPVDCAQAKQAITVTASSVLSGNELVLVGVTSERGSFGPVLAGVNAPDGIPCTASVDEVFGISRLTSTCSGRARYLLCKPR